MEEITTSRLRLRPLILDDLDSLTKIWTDPAISKYLLTHPMGRSEVEARLHSMIEHAKLWGMWAIELKQAHVLIGRCGFYPYSGEGVRGPAAEPELAFFLARSHWGRGLATEAAGTILRELFRSSECPRAVALVHPQNAASRRVLDKLGMSLGPTVRIHGGEALLYSIERTGPGVEVASMATEHALKIRELPAVSQEDWDVLFAGNPDPFGIEPLRLQMRAKDLHFILDLDERAASHVSALLSHTLRVGSLEVQVSGIGGVLTRPDVRQQGFAARLLRHALDYLKTGCNSEFALLFCLPRLVAYYRSLGWREVHEEVDIEQPGVEIPSPLCVMVIPLRHGEWPPGRVRLESLPW